MKTFLRLLIRLYPGWWRRRYSKELEALLEDSGSQDVWDLFRAAMEMQMKTWPFGRIVTVCGIGGVILAGAVAFSMPYRYRSTATLKLEGDASPATWHALATAAFTRPALTDIINREHLYAHERAEDAFDLMQRAIRLEPAGPNLARVSFAYEDAAQTQRASQDLVGKLIEANLITHGVNGTVLRLQLAIPPNQPTKQIERKRYGLAGLGMPAGMLFGVVVALFFRRRAPAAS